MVSDAVVLTDAGDEAAAALGAVEVIFAPAAKLQKSSVVDTTGARDAFIGSMLRRRDGARAEGRHATGRVRRGEKRCGSLGARPGLLTSRRCPRLCSRARRSRRSGRRRGEQDRVEAAGCAEGEGAAEMTDIDKEFADGTRKSIAPGLSKWMLKLGRVSVKGCFKI